MAKQRKHNTGWYVWVGDRKRWFADENRARDFVQLRQSQYGTALVSMERARDGAVTSTRNPRAADRKSGYYVWVGSDKKWFRNLTKAYAYYSRRVRQLGDSVVSLNHAGSGNQVSGAELRGKPDYQGNPRAGVKLPRTGHTGFLRAKAVDVVTRNGRVVEVKVKR